ncbi:MAG: alanine racemase [Comamonadaceae bacterium]|nr:alanine racemase [Comamonadaceae bacterium]
MDRQWAKHGIPADVLIEVNLGGEASKTGVDETAVEPLLRRFAQLPHLAVRGLMAIPLLRRSRTSVLISGG